MDDTYDAIVLGTGLTECVLSGLLSVSGKKVLHMDRNNYYGGECASLNLEQLFEKFGRGKAPAELGKSHLYNVDLCPKLLMANGKLVKILRKTVAARYNMEFMVIEGSYVCRDGKIHKVPTNEKEALNSSLMGLFEKRRAGKFLEWVSNYDEKDKKTHNDLPDLRTITMAECFKKFKLEPKTQDFMGHAAALQTTDEYMQQPAWDTVQKLKLYADSMAMYGFSPYVYPLYGLGDIPQAFARLCAVYGGTYMLNKPVDEIVVNEQGKFVGVKSGDEVAKAPLVVGDPSYFTDIGKVKKSGKVVRCICLMDHPIPNTADKARSCQIIIPQSELKRKTDMYIICVSYAHKVCPEPYFIAMVSATVETDNPEAELAPGLKMLGNIKEKFFSISDAYVPTNSASEDGCFISTSMDATTHFESCSADIVSLFQQITGKEYDVDAPDEAEAQQ